MDGVTRAEALIWLALERADGWLRQAQLACAAGVCIKTVCRALTPLLDDGLAEVVRVGNVRCYRLVPRAAGLRQHAARVKLTVAVLGLEATPCGKRRKAG